VYAPWRLGIYFNLSEYLKNTVNGGSPMTIPQKVGASLFAGAFGSFIATPCDLVLVRMQADQRPGLAPEMRRNYNGVFDAFRRIVADEGATSLYTGACATMLRAMALNMWMMVSFDTAKEKMAAAMPDASSQKVTMYASLVSSCFTACGTLPFDNIKTKLQNQKANAEGVKPFTGWMDCFNKTVKAEGVTGLWSGLPTFYFRVGPHAIIILLVSSALRERFL
jgi:solute carrier family 25 (mitochondrial oxoglutarate transporter), member 11